MANNSSNPVWDRIKRGLPTPVRAFGNAFGDQNPEEGDDAITQVDDPATAYLGALTGKALESGAAAAAPGIARLLADDAGSVKLPNVGSVAPEELNMSELPRKMRAIDQGFDPNKTWYHGTKADIEAFDPNALGASTNAGSARQGYFFASDPSTASDYSKLSNPRALLRSQAGLDVGDDAFNLATTDPKSALWKAEEDLSRAKRNTPESWDRYKKMLEESQESILGKLNGSVENKYAPRDYLEQKLAENKAKIDALEIPTQEQYASELDRAQKAHDIAKQRLELGDSLEANVVPSNLKMENPYIHDFKGSDYRDTKYADIMKMAKEKGHDSVIFKNTYDPADPNNRVMQDIAAVFDPSQIRSKFAAFDPSKAGSGNISSALAGVGLGGAAIADNGSDAQASEGDKSMGKPAFDPSKPFDVAPEGAKPAFDPSKPFQAAGDVDETPMAASAAAGFMSGIPMGAQMGAAGKTAMDVLSGNTGPSDAMDQYRRERDSLKGDLARVAGANPKSALIGGLASAPFVPVPASVGGMAAYGGASALGNSKADLTKGEVLPALMDTGTGAAAGAAVGAAAPYVSKAVGSVANPVADYIKNKADKLYVAATKIPGVTAYNKLKDNAGQVLRDYVGFGDTQGQIAKKLGAGFENSNDVLAEARQAITNSGGGQDYESIIGDIRKRASELKELDATRPLGQKLDAHADELEARLTDHTEDNPDAVSMTDLGKNKTKYQNQGKAAFANPLDASVASELGSIYKAAEERAANESDPELNRAFQDSRQKSSDLNQLSELSQKKAAVYGQGPALNLHALRPGAMGAMLGGEEGYRHGGITGGLAGAAAGALIGPRVASSAAVTADALQNLIRSAPESLGKFAPMLSQAATRGTAALMTADKRLRDSNPEYADTVDKAMSLDDIPESDGPKTVLVKNPINGRIKVIPRELLDKALSAGGVLVK